MFGRPDRKKYGAKPFWAWNGKLDKDELVRQTEVMKEMGFGGYFMHSRTGLATEYLSDEWFDDINACADAAEKEDMEAWLYDEDRWPSGSAGGIATKEIKYRMQYIRCNIVIKDSFEWSDDIICAFSADVDGINFTDCVKIEKHTDIASLPARNVIYFTQEYMIPSSTYNESAYLDTLSAEATEHFIETTHDLYAKKCGKRLGKSIQGIFTDEPYRGALMTGFSVPNRDPLMLTPYTDSLFDDFKKAYGYDLKCFLPDLFLRRDGKYYAKVKWQYTELLTELFIKNFMKPYRNWCKDHGILFTGHMLHEDRLSYQVSTNGSVMRCYEHMDVPGVDVLCNNNNSYCIVKQLSSAARQLGQKMLMSELNGCTGWQMRFSDYKNIGDWQAIMGINLRCPHLSWYTMQGESKRDYPASILHQSAWYKAYSYLEDHYTRIGEITGTADRVCKTAVIMPVESLWVQIYAGWAEGMLNVSEEIKPYDDDFDLLYKTLLKAHVDFDFADEEMLDRLGSVEDGKLIIGKADYRRVIVPSMLTIRRSTLETLKKFKENGGEVIFSGITPILVDAEESDEAKDFSELCEKTAIEDLINLHDKTIISSKKILIQTYKDENNKYCFLLNSDPHNAVRDVTVDFGKDVALQLWDTLSGKIYSVESANGKFTTDFEKGQLKLLVIPYEETLDTEPLPEYKEIERVTADSEPEITLDEPNVLVLDYASFSLDGGDFSEQKPILVIDRCIREEVGLPVRGGMMDQPWYTALNEHKTKAKVETVFKFENEGYDGHILLCCEEPENFEISINGKPLDGEPIEGIYIDKCFNRFDITSYTVNGTNTISFKTDFNERSNLEAIYLLGDFSADTNAKIYPKKRLSFGNLAEQGLPFYGGTLKYSLRFAKTPKDGQRAVLHLSDDENIACCTVGKETVAFPPYICDVTDTLGDDGKLDLTVYLTRRNMFGPLHDSVKMPDFIGPEAFLKEDSEEYTLFSAGLTEKPYITIEE